MPRKPTFYFVDLFSGTGSFGAAARVWAANHGMRFELLSLDIHPKYNPTHCVDLMKWDYQRALREFLPRKPREDDIIWVHASPPCNAYSFANNYYADKDFGSSDKLVRRVFRIIDSVRPDFWTVENPRGFLRTRPFMKPMQKYEHLTSYCHFGSQFRKDTNIWTNVDVSLPVCRAGSECRYKAENGLHQAVAQTRDKIPGPQYRLIQSVEELYALPRRLCTHLLNAALD